LTPDKGGTPIFVERLEDLELSDFQTEFRLSSFFSKMVVDYLKFSRARIAFMPSEV
jgi:hypothetical protein